MRASYGNICEVEAFVARMTINEDLRGNRRLQKSRVRDVPLCMQGTIPLGVRARILSGRKLFLKSKAWGVGG